MGDCGTSAMTPFVLTPSGSCQLLLAWAGAADLLPSGLHLFHRFAPRIVLGIGMNATAPEILRLDS